jgi:hypothetical protein
MTLRQIFETIPPGNLFGRPVQDQFTRNDVPQPAVDAQQTSLRTQGRSPSLAIGIMGTIGRTATMATTSRHTEEAARSRPRAISRSGEPEAIPREMSSRSARVSANRERRRAAGGIPPRGNNTARMQLCGLSKTRPISCSDCPALQRLQTSRFSIAESPNRIPSLIPTPPLRSRFKSDGVASTYRMHRVYQALIGKKSLTSGLSRANRVSIGSLDHVQNRTDHGAYLTDTPLLQAYLTFRGVRNDSTPSNQKYHRHS